MEFAGGDTSFTTELAFFTTEHTEDYMRATEDYHFLGELRASRKVRCGVLSLPQLLPSSVALSRSRCAPW